MPASLPPHMSSGLGEPINTVRRLPAPGPRELRAQAVHRLQVGLFGLCAMLLIVGLANIIMDRARMVDSADPIHAVVAADAKPKKQASDPLADIGVVPAADPSPTPAASDSDTADLPAQP